MMPGGPVIGVVLATPEGNVMARRIGKYSVIEIYDADTPIGGSPIAQPMPVEVRQYDARAMTIEAAGEAVRVETLAPLHNKMKRAPSAEEIQGIVEKTGLEAAMVAFAEEMTALCATEQTSESDTQNSNDAP